MDSKSTNNGRYIFSVFQVLRPEEPGTKSMLPRALCYSENRDLNRLDKKEPIP